MPTNILRRGSRKPATAPSTRSSATSVDRFAVIRAGGVRIRIRLSNTPTADRIWRALPIFSTAQLWGQGEVFFETRIESGRERGAKVLVHAGEIAFSPDRDVIAIAFARTPTSKPGELRLWSPSNIWAQALDDVTTLQSVRPGEKIEVRALPADPADDLGT
jgi:hypothetical protein